MKLKKLKDIDEKNIYQSIYDLIIPQPKIYWKSKNVQNASIIIWYNVETLHAAAFLSMEFHDSFHLMTNIFASHGILMHVDIYLLHSNGIIKNPKLCAHLNWVAPMNLLSGAL